VPAIAALAVSAAPAGAVLRWSDPAILSEPGSTGLVRVASDARGDSLVVWGTYRDDGSGYHELFYRWRSPRGGWTDTRSVPIRNLGLLSVDLAMTPAGDAMIVGTHREGRIRMATARPGGAFGDPVAVGDAADRATGLDLAMDDEGNAVLAWVRDTYGDPNPDGSRTRDSAVRVATRKAGAEFGDPVTLDTESGAVVAFAAMNAAGAAVVVWGGSGETGIRPFASYRPPAGSFGPPERVPVDARGPTFRTAVNVAGEAVVTLNEVIYSAGQTNAGSSYAVRSPLGGWSDEQVIDTRGYATEVYAEPSGAVSFLLDMPDPGGSAQEPRRQVGFASRLASGVVSGPRQISKDQGSLGGGAMNLRGDILAAWSDRADGTGRIAVAERPAGTVFGEELPISAPNGLGAAPALNDAGQALVAWMHTPTPNYAVGSRVEAAVREDPALPTLPFPPDVDLGAPLDPVLDDDGIAVPVACDVSCTVEPTGLLYEGADATARAKRAARTKLAAKARGRVRVRFGAAARKSARKALARGRKAWVALTVRAKGRSPRTVAFSRRVRLKR
jgi:hypothetical protein